MRTYVDTHDCDRKVSGVTALSQWEKRHCWLVDSIEMNLNSHHLCRTIWFDTSTWRMLVCSRRSWWWVDQRGMMPLQTWRKLWLWWWSLRDEHKGRDVWGCSNARVYMCFSNVDRDVCAHMQCSGALSMMWGDIGLHSIQSWRTWNVNIQCGEW